MSSSEGSGYQRTGSSFESAKLEATPASEIEYLCPKPKNPSILPPPSSLLRPHLWCRKEFAPPPKHSKSITKKQQPFNSTPPRPTPKNSSLETYKAAVRQGAFLKTHELRKNLARQLHEPWATHRERSFHRPPPVYSPDTAQKLREYHKSTLDAQYQTMTSTTVPDAMYNARKDLANWKAFEKLENRYRETYGFPPKMETGEYFDDKRKMRTQLGSWEWRTRTTVAPKEGGPGLEIRWIVEHPVIPFLKEKERRRDFWALEVGVREDVFQLQRRLKWGLRDDWDDRWDGDRCTIRELLGKGRSV